VHLEEVLVNRHLVRLEPAQLNAIVAISGDGPICVDTDVLARRISKAVGLVSVRVAVSSADYLQQDDGTPEPGTRTVSGIWWLSHGDDTALIGGFAIEGRAMTITTEGEGEAPLAEGVEILDRATSAIISQYEGAQIVETGLARVPGPSGERPVRVVVTRDHRIRRPQDIMSPEEMVEFEAGRLGLAIIQTIGGGKALMVKHGL
jgi:hypothetical protein